MDLVCDLTLIRVWSARALSSDPVLSLGDDGNHPYPHRDRPRLCEVTLGFSLLKLGDRSRLIEKAAFSYFMRRYR
jgi:hypothetical protein